MKMIKVAISMLLIFCTFFCSGVSVFATEPTTPTADGGLTEYDGSLITYDYVKKNPALFKDYDITGLKLGDIMNVGTGSASEMYSMIHKEYILKSTGKKCVINGCNQCVNTFKYVYAVGVFYTHEVKSNPPMYFHGDQFRLIFTKKPLRYEDNYFHDLATDDSFDNARIYKYVDEPSTYIEFGGGGKTLCGKSLCWQLGSNLTVDKMRRGTGLSVVYPMSDGIKTIVDSDGNQIGGTGTVIGSDTSNKGYRVQRVLEQYSKYKADNYPKANPLEKFSDWILDPQTAYNKDDTVLSGGKNAFRGFYFNPISSPNPAGNISILKKRYTYHLYLWDGTKWKQKTVWSNKIMLFSGGIQQNEYVVAPKFIMQKNNFGIVYDYETKTMSAVNADNIFTDGSENNSDLNYVSFDNFYIVNDDVAILYDKDTGNLGSIIYTEDNTIYDTDGSDIGKGEDIGGGTIVPPGHFDPLPKPGDGAGLTEWIAYFMDNIDDFFETITNGFKGLVSSATSFFKFIGSSFSFLPVEIWGMLTLGIGIVIILRFLGR